MGYKKTDIQLHSNGPFDPPVPAVCVKARFRSPVSGRKGFPLVEDVIERYGCSGEVATRVLGYAFDVHAEAFWEAAEGIANDILGKAFPERLLTVYQQGRSGGWLVVEYAPNDYRHGDCNALPPVESWDAVQVAAWGRFEKAINDAVDFYCNAEEVFDTIEANGWLEP